uniref:HECT domain-containing protein n=1 Tax=Anabas testudineus TaxID=64144 RepID=A0A7N6BZ48_ANATE
MLCWGNAQDGQLGAGVERNAVLEPRNCHVFSGRGLKEIACGWQHSMFLLRDGSVYTCGSNSCGQLGHDKPGASPELVVALDTQKITMVSSGRAHCVAINEQGQVFAWGAGEGGQLGLGTTETVVRIPRLLKRLCDHQISQVMCGNQHCIALSRDGQLFTWGQNTSGQLGLGKGEPSKLFPHPLKSLAGIPLAQITAGGDHSFALSLSGAVFGWGKNRAGQLGLNDKQDRPVPCHIKFLRSQKVVYISCGDEHTAALTKDGGLFTFGDGSWGQLGHGSTNNELLPRRVLELMGTEVSQIACGRHHTLAFVPSSGIVYAFGCNSYGQLGTGILEDASSPFPKACYTNPSKVLDNWWCLVDGNVFTRMVDMYKSIVVFMLTGGKTLLVPMFYENYFLATLSLLEKLHKVSTAGHLLLTRNYNMYKVYLNHFLFSLQSDFPSVNLCAYPFILNAQAKTTMLQTDAELQMQMAVSGANLHNVLMLLTLEPHLARNPYLVLHVRRNRLVSDTLRELTMYSDVDLKKPLKVIFDGEEAVDAGGVTKEFFLLLLKELMDPVYGMFTHYNESNLLWFSDKCFVEQNWFHLIGIICGLAIYNSTVVDLHFPLVLYKKLLGVSPTLEDFKELSPTEARSLQQLLDYEGSDVEETFLLKQINDLYVYLLCVCVCVYVCVFFRNEFVEAYLRYVFSDSVSEQYSAFSSGFLKVCGGEILSLFQPSELMAMVVGNNNYNWEEMEKNAVYKGEYTATHPTVRLFWEVFHEFPLEKKKQFLLFLTGSDRIPIHGMESMRIIIQSTTAEEHYLPVAHTCYNLLDMPRYQTKDILRRRLTQAVEQYEGFSLV